MDEVLRWYRIGSMRCEPHLQNQNPAERRIQDIKRMSNGLMDRTGCPAYLWLLCVLFIVGLMNHLAWETLNNRTPIEVATGQTPDISKYLQFKFYQPVYFLDKEGYPSEPRERVGHFMGPADNIGDILTYQIWCPDTEKLIFRSCVRACGNGPPNIRAWNALQPDAQDGECDDDDVIAHPTHGKIQSAIDVVTGEECEDPGALRMPRFTPEELMGKVFLLPQEMAPDGKPMRAEVVRKVQDMNAENHQNIKMIVKIGDESVEQLLDYATVSDMVENYCENPDLEDDKIWCYDEITGHQEVRPRDPRYKGCRWNVKILWEDGTETWEPLNVVALDDPVKCVEYGREKKLLHKPGWKFLKKYKDQCDVQNVKSTS